MYSIFVGKKNEIYNKSYRSDYKSINLPLFSLFSMTHLENEKKGRIIEVSSSR